MREAVIARARGGEASTSLDQGEPPGFVACVARAPDGDPIDAMQALLVELRERSSRSSVRALGRDEGYRVEDIEVAVLAVPPDLDRHPGSARLAAWLKRRLAKHVEVIVRPGPIALAVGIAGRVGRAPERVRYARGADGRVRVEAFELHVAEHCNLRCANCCNMSPLVGEKLLSVDEVALFTRRMAQLLVADVVKIMGGEPLLHPDLPAVLRVLRESGIGDRVRLFTNGLLLPAMPEAFWEALDELTISSYTSAPVKPAVLAMVRERAKWHDFVLNVKPVDEFAQVLSPRYEGDDERAQRTYERCWLRHRCLVVRDRKFYMCTRAAYADDFLHRVAHEAPPAPLDRSSDGIAIFPGDAGGELIDAPDLAAALEAYLNREQPLGACRYCFGGDGATEAHYQLTRAEITQGVLSRRLRLAP
jgi:organic radical activating enzyme